jgi:hypothetical protein
MYFIHSTISIQRYMPQCEESNSTASEYVRTLSPANLRVYGRPYDCNGPQLSICIPSTAPSALRSTFSRFRRASRSARRLRKATAAVGSEALRTAMRRSRFGARTMSGSDSASTAGSTASGGPEPRGPGERARLRLRRKVALGLSGPEECPHRWTSVRSTFFYSFTVGKTGEGWDGARTVYLRRRPSLRAPALDPRRPRRPCLYCLRRAPSPGWRPSLLHLPHQTGPQA